MIDGVIAITHIEADRPFEGAPTATVSNCMDLSAVLGAVFFKLHRRTSSSTANLSGEVEAAKTTVESSLTSGLPLPKLPDRAFYSWLPAALSRHPGIQQSTIEHEMRAWLNYVIVHVKQEHQAYSVIKECLRRDGCNNVATLKWDLHQTYPIGSW